MKILLDCIHYAISDLKMTNDARKRIV